MKTRIRRNVRRGRPQILPSQPDADQWLILRRLAKGEKMFLLQEHPVAPDVGIGSSREYAKTIPSRQFGYLMTGGWLRFVAETREYELTSQGYRAIELYRPSTRVGSKNTYRIKRRAL